MRRNLLIMIVLFIAAGPAFAQQATIGETPDMAVQKELESLRHELAQAKLKLETAQAELAKLKEFLSDKNLDAKMAQWSQQRRMLAEERLRLQRERHNLQQARNKLGQASTQHVQQQAAARDKAAEEKEESLKPQWSVQYMLGYISDNRETYYTRVVNGRVYTSRDLDNNIDTRNVKVKGTFLNNSEAPWRYTFEIRLGGEGQSTDKGRAPVLGQWRVQTPLLGPGDLHSFEVVIPVKSAYQVETVQVGEVTADRPAQLIPVTNIQPAQPGAAQPNPAAPGVGGTAGTFRP